MEGGTVPVDSFCELTGDEDLVARIYLVSDEGDQVVNFEQGGFLPVSESFGERSLGVSVGWGKVEELTEPAP